MRVRLAKIWALFTPPEKRRALVMLGLVLLMAFMETLGVLSIMPFLSVLARPSIVEEHPVLQVVYEYSGAADPKSFILMLGVATMVVVVLSSAVKSVILHQVNRFVHFQRHSLSTRLLSRYLQQPYEFFLARSPSELSKNVLSEVDQLALELLQPLAMLIAQGAVVTAITVMVLAYDPWMALCIVAVVGSLYGAVYLLVRRRLAHIGALRADANTGRYKTCNEALGGIKEVKVTGSAGAHLNTFSSSSREYSRHRASAETLSQSPLYAVEAVGYSGLIIISLVLLWQSDDMARVLPALGLYGFAAYRLLPAAQIMYRGFARLRFSSSTLDSLHRDLSLPLDGNWSDSEKAIAPAREIRLQNVRYAYPSAPDKPVINDFDLLIPANSSMGIMGKSGTGKSTLIDLLLGLLHPQRGSVLVDGSPITRSNVHQWQRGIGYVPQHIYLSDTSVAENIAFGVQKKDIDMESVKRAARAAQIHDFIADELPYGYLTCVGDRGIRLSGGQRQRLGIARALYRNPPTILMDEATSALDVTTETAITKAIQQMAGAKTIIIVSHRASSISFCDRILHL